MYRSFLSLQKVLLPGCLFLTGVSAFAGMNEATKAYIQGDYPKARYEALIGATDGDPAAQMLMGQLYFNGEGVEKNIELAMYWYQQAASNGFKEAQFRLGKLFFDGGTGVEKNYNKAWEWLMKADTAGHDKTEPMLELLYKQEDSGHVVNLNESPEVLKLASDKGVLKAQYLLASNMIKAGGAPTDRTQAVALMTNAAKKGFIKAQKRLGEWYLKGLGVETNYIEAYGWSMAYAGTKELGGIIREGKQAARTSLRNLPGDQHETAYLKSKEYFEQFVLPFHSNAREVGPDKYRIVVRSKVDDKKTTVTRQSPASATKTQSTAGKAPPGTTTAKANSPASSAPVAKVPASSPAVSNTSVAQNDSSNATSGSAGLDKSAALAGKIKPAGTAPEKTASADNQQPASQAPVQPSVSSADISGQKAQLMDSKKSPKPVETAADANHSSQVDVKQADASQQSTPATAEPDRPAENGEANKSEETRSAAEATIPDVEPAVALNTAATANSGREQTEQLAKRSKNQVARAFDTYLLKINEIHLRNFQSDNSIQGRMTVMLHIEPDGSVSKVELSSSEIQSTQFEQDLSDYLRTLKFGAGKVAPFLFTYQLDLLPQ